MVQNTAQPSSQNLSLRLKEALTWKKGTPNYDIKQLALECATKRMYPDVLSYDKIIELTGSFKVPMGCRSFLQGWKDENGVEVNSGRMNLGVVTVNLPRIALESEGDLNKFWEIFNERMNIAEDALVYRVERTKEATPANAPSFISMEPSAAVSEKKKVLTNSLRIAVRQFRWATSVCTKWLQSSLEIAGKAILKPRNSHWILFAI